MKKLLLAAIFAAGVAFAGPLTTGVSDLSVDETSAKLQQILSQKGLKIFGVFEHSKLAKDVELEMTNTTVVAFGAPKAGTPLMQCAPQVAIELPLKMLIYKGENGQTIVAYEDIKSIAARYDAKCGAVVENLSKAQANFFKAITK